MAAAKVLLGIDRRRLAELSSLYVAAIQRMESSATMVRGNVDSLFKLVAAFEAAEIELIDDGTASHSQRRGVQLKADSASARPVRRAQARNTLSSRTRARS